MSSAVTEVLIPAPLPHQEPIVASAARFKVVRAGRRGGKTVLAEHCSIVGHGPTDYNGLPVFRGIAQGLDVVWVARDYTQAGIMWHEFIRPRFKHKPGVRVNEVERTVTLDGAGTLFVVSAENIYSVKGVGKRLAGVVIEEAAWLATGEVLRDVIMPALMDNEGWLLLISTTNAGPDGGKTESGGPQAPSYFNQICQEIRSGQRSGEWAEFHFTARDNPKISQRAFDALVAEYGSADSPSLHQEVYADLITAGAGLAFPEFLDEVHVIPNRLPPRHWKIIAAMDWGYRQGAYGLFAIGTEGEIEQVWEYYSEFRDLHARAAAVAIAHAIQDAGLPTPEYIAADTQMWQIMGAAETVAEEFNEGLVEAYGQYAPPLLEMKHGPNSRKPKKNLTHRYLAWEDKRDKDGKVQPWSRPLLRFQQRCAHTIRTFKTLPLDANRPDDVDTKAEDHAFDMVAFVLSSRPPLAELKTRVTKFEQDNRHPGFDYEKRMAREWTSDDMETPIIPRNPLSYKVPPR